MLDIQPIILSIILFPLAGSLISGLWGDIIGIRGTHWITCSSLGVAFLLSCLTGKLYFIDHAPLYNDVIYTWAKSGTFTFNIGFWIDPLSTLMLLIITFISLLVHLYSIEYMRGDSGYSRFFSYMSFFTFSMLMLVTANNLFQVYFGWEAVGLASYLLIGFWFKKESANQASLKAFLVNRVSDVGFILGIAVMLAYVGSVDFSAIFEKIPQLQDHSNSITLICILLLIGAMGKSAQMPFHVWLPESMEGPTPISALIHAATMVTAGIYLIARLSPVFEFSNMALTAMLVIGATTAFLTGLVGLVQNDIKRIIAYSTLSQLGYMMAALGASAFTASLFHLLTHAAFKALLFLAAGSVILAMRHEQNISHMGGLFKRLPYTYILFLIGALALSAFPFFSGFYSKEAILEAVKLSTVRGAHYAYLLLLTGTFITALYIFRLCFLTFHGRTRLDSAHYQAVREPGAIIHSILILLAIPSALIGILLAEPMLYAKISILKNSVFILNAYNVEAQMAQGFLGMKAQTLDSLRTLPFYFMLTGMLVAWILYIKYPEWNKILLRPFRGIRFILIHKYGFDIFYNKVFVRGTHRLACVFYDILDTRFIDSILVNGSGRFIALCSRALGTLQSGYLFHYLLSMILGLIAFLIWKVIL